ncbi:hypothetical protein V6N12_049035 [Hibiscus sabdariffa]|uniref:Uncharacterized protein n=1 Tax=Hibiscus sabdariffa TaxID=183260 RepID=A0ABR2EJD9_9ROSI
MTMKEESFSFDESSIALLEDDLIKSMDETHPFEEMLMTMGEDFQANPSVVLDQIRDVTDETFCDMKAQLSNVESMWNLEK